MINSYIEPKQAAWLKQLNSGNHEANVIKVISWVKRNPKTTLYNMYRVFDRIMPSQTLSPALVGAIDFGFIKSVGSAKLGMSDDLNDYSMWVYVEDEKERLELAIARHKKKYIAWAKRGIVEFGEFLDPHVLAFLKTNIGYKEKKKKGFCKLEN